MFNHFYDFLWLKLVTPFRFYEVFSRGSDFEKPSQNSQKSRPYFPIICDPTHYYYFPLLFPIIPCSSDLKTLQYVQSFREDERAFPQVSMRSIFSRTIF